MWSVVFRFWRASGVRIPSFKWFGQHLFPSAISIFFSTNTESLDSDGTTTNLGPGRLQIKQYAWLFTVDEIGKWMDGGLVCVAGFFEVCRGSWCWKSSSLSVSESCVLWWMLAVLERSFLYTWRHLLQIMDLFGAEIRNVFCKYLQMSLLTVYLSLGLTRLVQQTQLKLFLSLRGILLYKIHMYNK